jgi:undecaprenyl-diphosphatase
MTLLNIVILAVVQGLAELLPISSSAHVVVAEKLLGLDPSSPPMTLLLVMLHTGTMFAVIVYFWRQWRGTYFQSGAAFKSFAVRIVVATLFTGIVGEAIKILIEKTLLRSVPHGEIEDLFGHLEFIAPALAAAGVLILVAGLRERKAAAEAVAAGAAGGASAVGAMGLAGAAGAASAASAVGAVRPASDDGNDAPNLRHAGIIGVVQGLCLPFRGFSRSGATISTGMLLGVAKARAEAFSFALAVVLTPPVVLREVLRLLKAEHGGEAAGLASAAMLSLLGAVVAFIAGLVALKWLSRWLEGGRWYLFGIYCLVAAVVVAYLHSAGY